MTTVCCVWVRGHVPFSSDYVPKLHSMVRRWIDRPFRFVCLTDRPGAVAGCGLEAISIPTPKAMKGWWSKMEVHRKSHHLRGRVLYLDLDTLVVGPLAPILDFPAPFALAPHAGEFNGKDGKIVIKRFNSSVMVWDEGATDDLWRQWSKEVTYRLWGDQDFIAERMPHAARMPAAWFPRISQVDAPPFGEAKVILAKTPKNTEAARRYPWFREMWV